MMVRKKGRGSLRYQLSNRGKSFKIWDGIRNQTSTQNKESAFKRGVLLRQILGF